MPAALSTEQLVSDLRNLGLTAGLTLVAQTSLKQVGWVAGGPEAVIRALREVLGPGGTLVMASMTDRRILYDPGTTPTSDMGVVAEAFWRMPGAKRSVHPNSSFAAQGPLACEITSTHPLEDPEGIDSPVGKVYRRDGWVLLLGVDHSANTTIHLGESLSGVSYRRVKSVRLVENGKERTREVAFIDHCCRNFNQVGPLLERRGLVRVGKVGNARAQLMRSRDVVRTVRELLEKDKFFFLCPPDKGCSQCDEARAYAQGHASQVYRSRHPRGIGPFGPSHS